MRDFANYAFSLVEVGSILAIPWNVLPKKIEKGLGLTILFACMIIGAAANNLLSVNIFVKPLIMLGLFGVFSEMIFQGNMCTKIFYLILGMYIVGASEMCIANIVFSLPQQFSSTLINSTLMETVFTLGIKLIVIVCGIIFVRYINKLQPKLPRKYWYILDLMFVVFIEMLQLCIFIESNLTNNNQLSNNLKYVIVLSYLILIMGIGVIYFFGKICWAYERQTELEIFQLRSSELDKIVSYQMHMASELKNIRHDIKKHMANVSHLLDGAQVGQAREYVDQLGERLDNMKPVIKSGNSIVDVIMSKYSAVCKSKDIELILLVDEVPKLEISPVDISAIMDNLLDNAIEAVLRSNLEERCIEVKYFSYKGGLAIKIKNPYKGALNIQGEKLMTSKSELDTHGYGLKSIKTAIERNNGDFKYYIEKESFTAVVILPLK